MRTLILSISLLALSLPAYADNIAECDVVIIEEVVDASGKGGAGIARYKDSTDFLLSVYDPETPVMRDIEGEPIRGVTCKRRSLIPAPIDYNILATGIPLSMSENFDSRESGLITIFFNPDLDAFDYKYSGPDMSEADQARLDMRLSEFSKVLKEDLAKRAETDDAKNADQDTSESLDAKP